MGEVEVEVEVEVAFFSLLFQSEHAVRASMWSRLTGYLKP